MFLTYDPKQNNNKKHAVTRGNVWRSPWSFYACVFRTSQTRKKKTLNLAPLSSPRLIYQKRPPHWLAAVPAPKVESTGSARLSSLSLPPPPLHHSSKGRKEGRKDGWDGMRGLGGGWAGIKGHLPGGRQTQCRVCDGAVGCVPKGLAMALLPFFLRPSFGPPRRRWRLPVGVDGEEGSLETSWLLGRARQWTPLGNGTARGAAKVRDRGPQLVCFDVSFEPRELSWICIVLRQLDWFVPPHRVTLPGWDERAGLRFRNAIVITPRLFLRDPTPALN